MIKTAGERLLTFQRVKRLQQQNEKLSLELSRLRGELQPVEDMRRDVIAANLAVKAKFLGLPAKITPKLFQAQSEAELSTVLHEEIIDVLRDLSNGGEEPEEA